MRAAEPSGGMGAAPSTNADEIVRRRKPTMEVRPANRTADLPPLPEKVVVGGGGGGFQVVKPVLPPPVAPPASWLPPPAKPQSLDPPMPRLDGRLPSTGSGRFGSGTHPAGPDAGEALVVDEPPPPKPKPKSPPLSKVVIQNLVAAGVAVLLVLVLVATGGDDGYTSERFSVEEQQKLALLWKAEGLKVWGGAADAEVNAAVSTIGLALVTAMADDLDDRPISFLVVKERDVPQAFGLPDGTIVITAGMIRRLTSEAQLAAVLAHTIAHQALGHVDRAIDTSGEFATVTAAANEEAIHSLLGKTQLKPEPNKPSVAGPAKFVAMAVGVAESSASWLNNPANEASADALTLQALEDTGYDQTAMRAVLSEVLAPVRRQHANWLLQHPDLPTRLDDLKSADAGGRTNEAELEVLRKKLSPPPPKKDPAKDPAAVVVPSLAPATSADPAAPKTAPVVKKRRR
jgi:Zn-dependent protease with chaperone function